METQFLDLQTRDQSIIWHPFTQHMTDLAPIPIVRAKGAYLFAEDGKQYIDAMSSWWCNLHGHAHPYIAEKIAEQAHLLEHVMFADFTHRPAIELAERLQKILPGNLSRFFYSDNGSTAVEVALKIGFQYWYNQNPSHPKKTLVALRGGYHGDTFGAMSAAGRSSLNQPFWPFLFDVQLIDPPMRDTEQNSLEQLQQILEKNEAACFLFEPIVQAVGGMRFYSAEGLDNLMKTCRQSGVLLIADECMTGFGRTGPLFACEYIKEKPDMICLSKGLTGGAMPLAITACREEIYNQFLSSERKKAFLHGHTFTANPLGCAAALASLDLLETAESLTGRQLIEFEHKNFQKTHGNHPKWQRCEVLGTILVIEYRSKVQENYFSDIRNRLHRYFLEKCHIVIRPFGNTVHVIPPYCITVEDLQKIYNSLLNSVECL